MISPEHYCLGHIIDPVTPATFFSEYWEKKPLVVQRDSPDYFGNLITRDEIDRVIATLHLHHPDISITNAARNVDSSEYTFPSGMIDVARLYQAFADGGTIILPQLGLRVPTLAQLCRSMEEEMSTRFQTNIYLTPPNAQGFKAHYDSHDVFVLQVTGEKRWALYDTAVELPFRSQEFHPSRHQPGDVSMEFELKAGDVLYLPRGIMHDANTQGKDVSLHITLGVLFTSWTDLILEAVARVGLQCSELRHGLPVGFARSDFDRKPARQQFRKLLDRVLDEVDFDATLDHFADDLIATRHPLLVGQMTQIERLPSVTADTKAGVQPNLLYRVSTTDEHVEISCYGSKIRFPRHVEQALRFALSTEEFRVGQMSGNLDDAGKVVLIRRLVREGLIRLL